MPDPNYADGEPPGVFSLILGTIIIAILFVIVKSCFWGG